MTEEMAAGGGFGRDSGTMDFQLHFRFGLYYNKENIMEVLCLEDIDY